MLLVKRYMENKKQFKMLERKYCKKKQKKPLIGQSQFLTLSDSTPSGSSSSSDSLEDELE